MDYLLIFAFQILGNLANILQLCLTIDKEDDKDTFGQVVVKFWSRNRFSTLISIIVVLPLNLLGHYVVEKYTQLPSSIEYYALYSFGTAVIFGYAGQWLLYLLLNKATEKVKSKAEKLID